MRRPRRSTWFISSPWRPDWRFEGHLIKIEKMISQFTFRLTSWSLPVKKPSDGHVAALELQPVSSADRWSLSPAVVFSIWREVAAWLHKQLFDVSIMSPPSPSAFFLPLLPTPSLPSIALSLYLSLFDRHFSIRRNVNTYCEGTQSTMSYPMSDGVKMMTDRWHIVRW